MPSEPLLFNLFVIFTGAALFATAALYARQALVVSYILLGLICGPTLLGWARDAALIQGLADIGIMFLLFLLGLNMHPQKLFRLLHSATVVTVASSAAFAVLGALVALVFGFGLTEALVVGAACMFSSTIIGLKLLPTTVLHHQHTGEIIISVLLLQDVLAILLLVVLQARGGEQTLLIETTRLVLGLGAISLMAYLAERYLLIPLIARFDEIQEYIFLVAIGWCLGMAELASLLGLSREIGAFVAGVAVAASRISLFIAESLKPLRDFFLVIFFFSLGAGLDLGALGAVWVPALVLAALMLAVKPALFGWLLARAGEQRPRAVEIGVRLGQGSEFSLLIALLSVKTGTIGAAASSLIQLATILTMIVSMYAIVLRYPTPIAVDAALRRR